jgi:hypothetical protein
MRLGPIADLWDGRAAVTSAPARPFDVVRSLIPTALGAAVAIMDPAAKLLGSQPGTVRAIRLVVPVAFLVVSIVVICSRTRSAPSRVGFAAKRDAPTPSYRHGKAARTTAKLALLPLSCWFTYQVVHDGPNWMFRRRAVSGYVCTANGTPIRRTAIVVKDDLKTEVSGRGFTDDNGFFRAELRPWGKRPAIIEAVVDDCADPTTSIEEAHSSSNGCRDDELGVIQQRSTMEWTISCE